MRKVVACLSAVLLVLGACGSDSDADTKASQTVTEADALAFVGMDLDEGLRAIKEDVAANSIDLSKDLLGTEQAESEETSNRSTTIVAACPSSVEQNKVYDQVSMGVLPTADVTPEILQKGKDGDFRSLLSDCKP